MTSFLWEMSQPHASGVKCLPSKSLVANVPPPRLAASPGLGPQQEQLGGPGKGRERTNPPGRPLIPSVSMGAHHRSNYWGKLQPFTTCRSRRGAVLNGKLHGVSLVLLLLLFNSQGRRIYGLSLLIIRPSQIKMIDSSACFTAALGGYYSC